MGTEVPRIRVRDFGALKNMPVAEESPPPVPQPPPAQPPILLCPTGVTNSNIFLAFLPNGSQIPIQAIPFQTPQATVQPNPVQPDQMIKLPLPRPVFSIKPTPRPRPRPPPPKNPDIQFLGQNINNGVRPIRTYHRLPAPKSIQRTAPRKRVRVPSFYFTHGHLLKNCRVVVRDIFKCKPSPMVRKYLRRKFDKKCSKCKTVADADDFWMNVRSKEIRCVYCIKTNSQRSVDSFVDECKKVISELSDTEDDDEISNLLACF